MKRILRRIAAGWKRIAHKIGVFQTKVLVSLFYFILLGPVSLVLKLLRRDLLGVRDGGRKTFWHEREPEELTLERCKRQF
jgi:hypothetical protein